MFATSCVADPIRAAVRGCARERARVDLAPSGLRARMRGF